MIKNFYKWYSENVISRWTILIIDLCISFTSFLVVLMLLNNMSPTIKKYLTLEFSAFILLINGVSFLIFKSYVGIVRHTEIKDIVRILKANSFSFFALVFLNLIISYIDKEISSERNLRNLILFVHFLSSTFILIWLRFVVKGIFQRLLSRKSIVRYVVIFGAGASGRKALRIFSRDNKINYRILAFLDDNPKMHGKSIQGIFVYPLNWIQSNRPEPIDELLITIQNISPRRRSEIVELCLKQNIVVKMLPSIDQFLNGELLPNKLRHVAIEDLLQRETINISNPNIRNLIYGKRIIVTGAAGSIGSELVNQLVIYSPAELVCIDQAETALYDLQLTILPILKSTTLFKCYVSDITNYNRIFSIFSIHKSEIIFHAAAYKHVPVMEENPYEAVSVNVLGTHNLLEISKKLFVKKFILISTDKAINPTNIMGASKRLAEIIGQSFNTIRDNGESLEVVTVRFGNVLGSNGSVIPLFRKQLDYGGPLTVTHPEVTRYFMTISEACQLVLEAATMGKGREIYVFDMGNPVKIYDLAVKMIQLSGLQPGIDCDIVFTGLRPGEKLYEELYGKDEDNIATHHSKIMIANIKPVPYESVDSIVEDLKNAIDAMDDKELVSLIKKYLPEFIHLNEPSLNKIRRITRNIKT